ncbi:MAG: tetraacyldisaccharide 4'-kinase [Gemmatimonadetes bacterium]|nr:tetraacyldisaccharide 4'-kinase [Gemmatimonadota bacterium]
MIFHDAKLLHRWRAGEGGMLSGALMVLGYPITSIYSVLMAIRNSHYDRVGGQKVPGVKVVSVGNLAIGGTGKTPISAWVARALEARDLRSAIVSRGYGKDELILHKKWNPGTPIVADPDRLEAARLAGLDGADVVVLDDGFQHRRIARDFDIVLLSAEDTFPGYLLPSGPYREPIRSLKRADAVLVTRRTASRQVAERVIAQAEAIAPGALTAIIHLSPDAWQDLRGSPVTPPDRNVLAIAAVARPIEFSQSISNMVKGSVELMSFPDHHDYQVDDIAKIRRVACERTIAVTEKDAVKLAQYNDMLGEVRVLVERVQWESGRQEIERELDRLVGTTA